MEKNSTIADMKTLTASLSKLVKDGYTEDFKATEMGLLALQHENRYSPNEVEVVDFLRFEGASDPADNSILYVIKTNDGVKGTLTDAYGPYADPFVDKFIKQVEDITKKTDDDKSKNG